MPEGDPVPETPQPVVPPPKKPMNVKFYVTAGIALLLSIAVYQFFSKYKRVKETLEVTEHNLTATSDKLKVVEKNFSNYQSKVESNTSWVKEEFYESGKLKKRTAYNKNTANTASGGSTVLGSSTASSGVTTVGDSHTKATKDTQSGVPINGLVYLEVPFDTFTGKFSYLGLGISHSVLLDFWIGTEFQITDLQKPDPLTDLRFMFQLGHGIR